MIDKHLRTGGIYTDLNLDAIYRLPRLAMHRSWYRITDRRYAAALYSPENIPSRFNPAGVQGSALRTLTLTEDVATATFEISVHIDLRQMISSLKSMTLVEVEVGLSNIADLSDPDTVKEALGIDFGTLKGSGFRDHLSVTQKICMTLVEAGMEGAIFPSSTMIGRKTLVIFPQNVTSDKSVGVVNVWGLKLP